MEARVRPESRTNLQELVLTQQDVRGMVSVAQALQDQGHADLAARMLSGTLVRFKKRGEYRLAGVASLRLPPAVPEPTLAVQGYTDLTLNQLSGTNPFIGDATYEASGRQEAARLAAATAATGGLDLRQSAAAVWRKKVAQGWAPQLPQLLATHGIDRLLHDLEDVAMIEAVAENLEALPPAAPAAPAPAHQQPQVQLPAGLQAPLPATQPALQPAVHRPLLDHVPAAQLELPPHMIPQQQPALQQAGLVHDPDDLPPHLRAQPQQAAQQHMLQPAPPAPHQAALQQVQQQWPHQLWPVVQRQPVPPPLMAAERRRREAEEAARTPVLGGPPDPAGAAWDAAVVAEGQAPAAQQAAGAQLPAEQQQPVVAPAQQVAAVQQAEHQGTVSPKEQPAPQLEEARSLLLQLLEQQQQQQPEEPPPPPPPPQQPAEPLQQQQPQQQQQQQQLLLSHPQQQPFKAEPQQHAEPRAAQPEGQQPAEQQQVKREPLEGQLALQAAQQTAQQTAEQQQRPLPRSISAPAQRLVLGGAAAPSVLLRSISERPPAKQLPPGLQPQSAGGDAQQQPRQEWSVLVCNLGDAFTVEQLELYFRQRYPSVTSAALPRNERTGEPKGFGFVRFARREEQLRAAREMDGHVLPGGRKIGTGLAGTTGGALPPAAQPNAAPASGPAQQQAAAQAAAQQEKTDSPRQQPQQPQGPQQNPKQPPPNGQGEHCSLNGSRGKSPPLIGVPTTAAPAAARPAGAMAGLVPPVAALPTTQLGRQPSSPPAPGAAAPQAMLPMVWPAGMFGAAGMMPLLMQPGRLCYPAMRPGTPGMQGMPAMGMLGPGMFPGMPTGGFGMAAGSGIGTQGGVTARPPPPAAQQLPRPAQQLQHLGSGHSSADVVNLEAAGQPVGGAEPVQAQHSGSGRRSRSRSGRSRSRSRHSGRSRSRSRRSRSPHCSDKRRRWGSPHRRSRSRSPRRRSRSRSPRRGSGGRGPGPALPLWLPPLLTAAVKSVAFDCDGAPFAAIRLLAVLDDLRGERDCVYRAGCNLRHVCDYLHFTRMADVELRPEGPLIMRLHPR